MRNLKKVLALVLAMVMAFSLMTVAGAATADLTDLDTVSSTYNEAVQVLTGLEVFKGMTETTFQPKENITRAMVAAIIYRLVTGDVKDTYAGIYANYANFPDVVAKGADYWASGYIGYCANAGYLKGNEDGSFAPDRNVTGYEALAMILRAVGYDKNNEFTGANWSINVASTSRELGILSGVSEGQLVKAASRELVAHLLFNAATKAPTVTYTAALGYNQYTTTLITADSVKNDTLAWITFKLASGGDSDTWGRPGKRWFKDAEIDGEYDKKWDGGAAVGGKDVSVAFVAATPDASYTTAVTECKIAEDVGLKADKTYTLFTNGDDGNLYKVQRKDEVQTLGSQGTLVEVYDDDEIIVVINTFLAKVVGKTDLVYDGAGADAGHVKTNARLTLLVYNAVDEGTVKAVAADVTTHTPVGTYGYIESGTANYTQSVGDMVLVNAKTKNAQEDDGSVTVNVFLSAAKEDDGTNKDIDPTRWEDVNDADAVAVVLKALATEKGTADACDNKFKTLEVLKTAPTAVTGNQTVVYNNAGKHTVNGTTYNDAAWLVLDQAGRQTTSHTWYLDQYDNLIGAVTELVTCKYGTIEQIQWINGTLETGYALAKLRYMDGSTEQVTVKDLDLYTGNDGASDARKLVYAPAGSVGKYFAGDGETTAEVATTLQNNYWNGIYDLTNIDATEAEKDNGGWTGRDLYRITTNKDNTVSLAHVTYTKAGAPVPAHDKDAKIETGKSGVFQSGDGGDLLFYIDENTQFLLKTGVGAKATYTAVKGYDNVPTYNRANEETKGALVDWIDVNGDGFADYVFVVGTADSGSGVGLLYLTSDQVVEILREDGETDHYEIQGYLNGDKADNIKVKAQDRTAATYTPDDTAIDIIVPVLNDPDYYVGDDPDDETDDGAQFVNRMFMVKMTDGEIVGAVKWTEDQDEILDTDNKAESLAFDKTAADETLTPGSAYEGADMEIVFVDATATTSVTKIGSILKIGDPDATVVALTVPSSLQPVVGSWSADMTKKEVYVIYDADTLIVKAAYIADPMEPADDSKGEADELLEITELTVPGGMTVEDAKGNVLPTGTKNIKANASGKITLKVYTGTAAAPGIEFDETTAGSATHSYSAANGCHTYVITLTASCKVEFTAPIA